MSTDALIAEFSRWDPKTQAQVAAELERMRQASGQAWYCTVGRTCDGEPHEGFDYPHARGDQWPPEGKDWTTWLLHGGRGSGKTRSGSEWTRKKTASVARFAVIGPTVSHVRDVMVEGQSGLLAIFARFGIPADWEPSKRKITLGNGGLIFTYSAEEPDRLRGPEHGSAWLDEPAHMPLIDDVWNNLLLGLRMGKHPQVLCTTTPLPIPWIKRLKERPDTVSRQVSTYVNLKNLAPTFRDAVLSLYEGTRLGKQELHGEILEDVEGALWSLEMIHTTTEYDHRDMNRIAIGVDPSGSSSKSRDKVGIIGVGRREGTLYALADSTNNYTPDAWAAAAWRMYDELQADVIVAEKNYGGEMVLSTLRNHRIHTKGFLDGKIDLVHSRRGKEIRAEPIVGLYEQGRFYHVAGLDELVDEQVTWVPGVGKSPNRVDALVHAATELMDLAPPASIATPSGLILPPRHSSRPSMAASVWG